MKTNLLIFLIVLCLIGCQPIQYFLSRNEPLPWSYGDLRILDPVDNVEPDQDLIALYSRLTGQTFQIRIDLLDLSSEIQQDIYIAIDSQPGGSIQLPLSNTVVSNTNISWDYLIIIPASGKINVIDKYLSFINGMELMILRDPTIDAIVVSFNKNAIPMIPGHTKIQVLTTSVNSQIVVDRFDPVDIDATPPPRAKVLFAFWNTFQPITPAQTLRSWDGAHVGPMSGRHGLRYLIEAAAQSNIPVILLDLKQPDLLSALDYINALPRIRELVYRGVLVLPDVASYQELPSTSEIPPFFSPDSAIDQVLWNNLVAQNFGVGDSFVLFSRTENEDVGFFSGLCLLFRMCFSLYDGNYFVGDNDYAQFNNSAIPCNLQSYFLNSGQQTPEYSVTINCKRLLITSAIGSTNQLLLFGGDFSQSVFGDPTIVSEAFQYITSHPWIQVITMNDLFSIYNENTAIPLPYPTSTFTSGNSGLGDQLPLNSSADQIQNQILTLLSQSPSNQLTDLAWQVYSSLLQPGSHLLVSLRSNYVGQIGHIIAAAQWAEYPVPQTSCSIDLDLDGKDECIISTTNIFTTLEPEGGFLAFAFTKNSQGVHQIIGPTWEFAVGLSDPSTWDPTLGIIGDVDQVLGAFPDSIHNWRSYSILLGQGSVVMSSVDMTMRKAFEITTSGIHVDIGNLATVLFDAKIPFVVDPWIRFFPDWGIRYVQSPTPFGWRWGIESGQTIELRTQVDFSEFAFNDSHEVMSLPEDPNYDYPRGHYLPFPMAMVEIQTSQDFSVDIIVNP